MIPLKSAEIAKATKGLLYHGQNGQVIRGISTDSRSIKKGDFFIPLKGENFDGHQFIAEALEKGASGFVAENWNDAMKSKLQLKLEEGTVVIGVEDTLTAYQDIAHHVREKLQAKVVAITGSTGKTSVKDMLASILNRVMPVVFPPGNYNTEIGVPYTILQADEGTEVLVLEMAMRGSGQIKELAEIGSPDIGLLTNIGTTHFGLLGSIEKIVEAKAELISSMQREGTMVFNEDDPWTAQLIKRAPCSVITFGLDTKADVRANKINLDSAGYPSFQIISDYSEAIAVRLNIPGRFNVYNALAAATVAFLLGISAGDIRRGLQEATLSFLRMEVIKAPDGLTILNDTYNASPTSMRAALETLREVSLGRRKVAILGDMLELGAISDEEHLKLGEEVSQGGIDLLITIGKKASLIGQGAQEGGMGGEKILSFKTIAEAEEPLSQRVDSADVVLVKASRAIGLERVTNFLVKGQESRGKGQGTRSIGCIGLLLLGLSH